VTLTWRCDRENLYCAGRRGMGVILAKAARGAIPDWAERCVRVWATRRPRRFMRVTVSCWLLVQKASAPFAVWI
jgi:hypothetical protein